MRNRFDTVLNGQVWHCVKWNAWSNLVFSPCWDHKHGEKAWSNELDDHFQSTRSWTIAIQFCLNFTQIISLPDLLCWNGNFNSIQIIIHLFHFISFHHCLITPFHHSGHLTNLSSYHCCPTKPTNLSTLSKFCLYPLQKAIQLPR